MSTITAPPAVQVRLLELQELDSALARARAALARLRADPELQALQEQLVAARAALAEQEKRAHDADAEAADRSQRAASTRAHRDRTRSRLDGGEGGSKELVALQHELATLEDLLTGHDDEALAAMQAADEAEAALATARDALVAAETRVQERADAVRAEGRRVTEEGRTLTGRRAALAGLLPADLVALYDAARQRGGVGAVRLEGRRGAAGVDLSPADLARITALPPEAVAQDPETGTLLIRA